MLIDDDTVEKYITKIAAGSSIVIIEDSVVLFRYPNSLIRIRAEAVYDAEYERAVNDGLLTRASLEKLIEERNLFSTQKLLGKYKLKLDVEGYTESRQIEMKIVKERL